MKVTGAVQLYCYHFITRDKVYVQGIHLFKIKQPLSCPRCKLRTIPTEGSLMAIWSELETLLLELNTMRTGTWGQTPLSSWKYLKNACISESGCWALLEDSLSDVIPQNRSPHSHWAPWKTWWLYPRQTSECMNQVKANSQSRTWSLKKSTQIWRDEVQNKLNPSHAAEVPSFQ